MTMLAHSINKILSLVPEAMPLVKQASLDQEFPLDNKDSCFATAMQINYFKHIDYSPVDFMTMEKVAHAVNLYGLGADIAEMTEKMVKSAHLKKAQEELGSKDNYFLKQAGYVGEISSMMVSERSQGAEQLYKLAQEHGETPEDAVLLYSGHAGFDKEAALKALTVRYNETANTDFVKVAKAIVDAHNEGDTRLTSPGNLVKLANFVTVLDEKAGLHYKGFNFFQETMHVKEAAFKSALTVKVAGQSVPYEKLESVGEATIGQYLGKDVANEMNAGPENFKAVVETLPLDMQRLLLNLIKNV